MNIMIDYWFVIVALIVLLIFIGSAIILFFRQPSDAQLRKVKAWLLLAVTEAEKELGGGTGKLKLRYVYDLFIMRFTWLARVISFELFSDLVDQALDEMRDLLSSNKAVSLLVVGDDADVY